MAKLRLKPRDGVAAPAPPVEESAEWHPAQLPMAAPAPGTIPPLAGAADSAVPVRSDVPSVTDIVQFVKQLCLAYSQLAYYPADHPVAQRQLETAWRELQLAFAKLGDVSISLTEGKLLFFGMPVEERNPAVAKFSRHFEELHIHSIKFHRGLLFPEFKLFFAFFCQEARLIQEAGGVQQLITAKGITNISFNSAVYRVIEADEKVVKKTDIVTGHATDPNAAQGELVKYFASRLLEHAADQQALLAEIKNNPERLAGQIISILGEMGGEEMPDRDSMVEALLGNIRMVSDALSRQDPTATMDGGTSVSEAMLLFEQELQRKSHNLGSQAAVKFIKRITDVVSSYTDRAKAERVLGEFLHNERNLKSVEAMMRAVDPELAGGRRIAEQVRRLTQERGIAEEELVRHLETMTDMKTLDLRESVRPEPPEPPVAQLVEPPVQPPPKKPRAKRKPTVSHKFKPLAERIRGRLDHEFKDVQDKERLVEYLDTLYQRETTRLVAEKTATLQQEVSRSSHLLHEVEQVFANTNLGMALFNEDGTVGFLEHAEYLPWPITLGQPMPEEAAVLFRLARDKVVGSRLGRAEIIEILLQPDGKPEALLFRCKTPEPTPPKSEQ